MQHVTKSRHNPSSIQALNKSKDTVTRRHKAAY